MIELLIVIGILTVLASIVVVALSPTRQLASSRDAKRQSDIQSILNAVYQYAIDHNNLPTSIPTGSTQEICTLAASPCTNAVDLRSLSGVYLVSIPIDPHGTGTGTAYFIGRDPSGRLTVSAPLAETTTISISR